MQYGDLGFGLGFLVMSYREWVAFTKFYISWNSIRQQLMLSRKRLPGSRSRTAKDSANGQMDAGY